MGMPVRVVLYADTEAEARRAATAAFARVDALEQIFSDYRAGSEVSRLSARAQEWVPVSGELFALTRRAIEIARLTDGAFDPTVGPLVSLWREARRTKTLPPAATIESARARVGWPLIDLDEHRRAIRLKTEGMRLDFGGIAKGYILQDALRAAAAAGVTRPLLEATSSSATLRRSVMAGASRRQRATRRSRIKRAACATWRSRRPDLPHSSSRSTASVIHM